MLNAILEQTAMAACAGRELASAASCQGSAALLPTSPSSSFSTRLVSAFPPAVLLLLQLPGATDGWDFQQPGAQPCLWPPGRAGQEGQVVPVAGVNASTTTPAGHVSLCSAS